MPKSLNHLEERGLLTSSVPLSQTLNFLSDQIKSNAFLKVVFISVTTPNKKKKFNFLNVHCH